MRPGRLVALALVLTIVLPSTGMAQLTDVTGPPVLVPDQGPEVPPATDPVAERHPVKSSVRTWGDVGVHTHEMTVPDVAFDRVFLEYTSWPNHPNGDPWDRTFSVGVDGTELVHGTTTRGNFSITEDVTEYLALFEPGETVTVLTKLDTWEDNGIVEDVRFTFHDDPTAPAGDAPAQAVISPFYFDRLTGPGTTLETTASFPDEAPSSAVVELFTSGHGGCGEFWYTCPGNGATPPTFEIRVDGEPVGHVEAVPYVYALLGFDGDDQAGSDSEEQAALVNQHLWWSGHKVLDRAGVHHGVGEIPAYRAQLPADLLPLLTGEQTVTVEKVDHGGVWPTSLSFLLETTIAP